MRNENVFHQCDPERIHVNDMDTKDYNEGLNMAQPFSGIHRQIQKDLWESNEWNIKYIQYCTED